MKTSPLYELGANESPLGPSPKVIEAIHRAAGTLNRYPTRGDERVRDALARHHGRGLDRDHVVTACFHLSRLHIEAAIAALDDQDHGQRVVAMAQSGREYICASLRRSGIAVHPTESNGLRGCLRVTVGLPEANHAFIAALEEALGS